MSLVFFGVHSGDNGSARQSPGASDRAVLALWTVDCDFEMGIAGLVGFVVELIFFGFVSCDLVLWVGLALVKFIFSFGH